MAISELTWGVGKDEEIQKPDWVLEVEHFLLSESDQEDRSMEAEAATKGQKNQNRRLTAVDTWEPRPLQGKQILDLKNLNRFLPKEPLGLTQAVLDKWEAFAERHDAKHKSIKAYISASRPENLDPRIRHALSILYSVHRSEDVEQRSFWLGPDTQVHLLIVSKTIVTFVTFRGLRQLRKLIMHRINEWQITNPSEGERITEIGKQAFRRQVQGGLMQGKLTPRVRRG